MRPSGQGWVISRPGVLLRLGGGVQATWRGLGGQAGKGGLPTLFPGDNSGPFQEEAFPLRSLGVCSFPLPVALTSTDHQPGPLTWS